jgi:hypothetical protein
MIIDDVSIVVAKLAAACMASIAALAQRVSGTRTPSTNS